jgi:hypothetical protein
MDPPTYNHLHVQHSQQYPLQNSQIVPVTNLKPFDPNFKLIGITPSKQGQRTLEFKIGIVPQSNAHQEGMRKIKPSAGNDSTSLLT